MRELTVRDRVKLIQRQLRDSATTPERARESLMTLTGLLGNVADEFRAADAEYKPGALTVPRSWRRGQPSADQS